MDSLIHVRLPESARERAATLAVLCARSNLVPVPAGLVELLIDLPISDDAREKIEGFRDNIAAVRRDLKTHANYAAN